MEYKGKRPKRPIQNRIFAVAAEELLLNYGATTTVSHKSGIVMQFLGEQVIIPKTNRYYYLIFFPRQNFTTDKRVVTYAIKELKKFLDTYE